MARPPSRIASLLPIVDVPHAPYACSRPASIATHLRTHIP